MSSGLSIDRTGLLDKSFPEFVAAEGFSLLWPCQPAGAGAGVRAAASVIDESPKNLGNGTARNPHSPQPCLAADNYHAVDFDSTQ